MLLSANMKTLPNLPPFVFLAHIRWLSTSLGLLPNPKSVIPYVILFLSSTVPVLMGLRSCITYYFILLLLASSFSSFFITQNPGWLHQHFNNSNSLNPRIQAWPKARTKENVYTIDTSSLSGSSESSLSSASILPTLLITESRPRPQHKNPTTPTTNLKDITLPSPHELKGKVCCPIFPARLISSVPTRADEGGKVSERNPGEGRELRRRRRLRAPRKKLHAVPITTCT